MTAAPSEKVLPFRRKESRFIREPFFKIEPRGQEWLSKPAVPAQGVGYVVGASGTRKTFFVLDYALHVAHGRDFLGMKTKQAGVAYVAAEAPNGVRKRIKAWRHRRDGQAVWFDLIGQAPDLQSQEDVDELRQCLADIAEQAGANGVRLGLVVIDTLAASLTEADENTGKDMGGVIRRLGQIAVELNLLILLVAHTGKDESRGIRGWSGQYAAADVVLSIAKAEHDPKVSVVTVAKLKDGEDGRTFAFRLEQVELGRDEDGDAITSAVPVYEDAPEPSSKGRREKRLSAGAQKIQSAFGRLMDGGHDHPAPNVEGVRPGTRAVTLADLKTKAFEIGLCAAMEPGPEADAKERGRYHDNRKKAWARGIEQLEEHRVLRQERGFVWELRR
jgi:hypothetical protein